MADDSQARRRRAKSIHGQIDELLKGTPAEAERPKPGQHRRNVPGRRSPRDFIAERMRELDEASGAEDDDVPGEP